MITANDHILQPSHAVCLPMAVPDQSGVYIVWHGGRAQYVGRSNNLRKRIRTHLANYGDGASFTFEIIPHEQSAPRESELIAELNPPMNVVTPTPDGVKKTSANLTLRSDVRLLLSRMAEADNRSSISNMIEQLTLDEAKRRGLTKGKP